MNFIIPYFGDEGYCLKTKQTGLMKTQCENCEFHSTRNGILICLYDVEKSLPKSKIKSEDLIKALKTLDAYMKQL